ncbi:heterokaryon incompatibility protein-domain-containing protein [Chaetomium strumarium]|uniref:Heterokaryon incompatibility protein-domain-containing protein n=1 Tax=Chaetomium strumarium TaxID=1170767 RepID=A0AAJ0H1B7_9PEZI|nr:heterokaryon incompatibility protein-domain-containing protein [Chaetomium strumarium]
MNLWWPRSVPYFNNNNTKTPSESDPQPDFSLSTVTGPAPNRPFEPSPVYPTQLNPDEIRLACFQTTTGYPPSPGRPVHLTLETYLISNCPPYETVSYCWAGEDGNDARTRPVYIGPYWDVMVHTQNCWDLLRFVRPARGLRLVWVDAVCINQGCDEERAAQVAQMGRIYTICMQVLVYLGPEVAPLLPTGQYPRRARLQDLRLMRAGRWSGVTDVPVPGGVKELLQRRYFSRLWVVQELILSPRVVIRTGDVDFHSDGATSGKLWSGELGDPAHWVQYTFKAAPLELDLHQVMRLTFSAGCADPRDRVFGVLGIISGDSPHLAPDYSLSVQHVFIDLYSHLIAARGMGRLLVLHPGVSGDSGPASTPSWVPGWASWERWQAVFDRPPELGASDRDVIFKTSSAIQQYDPTIDRGAATITFLRLPVRYRWANLSRRGAPFGVDSATGTLRASMVRLAVLDHVPRLVSQLKDASLMLFELPCGKHHVYLVSRHRLDTVVEPGNDRLYLFALNEKDRAPGFCILRKDAGYKYGDAVRVVATCEVAFFRLLNPPKPPTPPSDMNHLGMSGNGIHIRRPEEIDAIPLPEHRPWRDNLLDNVCEEREDPLDMTYPPLKRAVIGDLYWTVDEVIESVQSWLDSALDANEQLLFLPRLNTKRRDFLPVYTAVMMYRNRDSFDERNGVWDIYQQYATDVLGAEHGFDSRLIFVLTAPFEAFHDFYKDHPDTLRWLTWGRIEQDPATVQVVFNKGTIMGILETSSAGCRHMLSMTADKVGESVYDELLFSTSASADRPEKVPNGWIGQTLIEECGCDGSVELVNIP